MRSTAFTLLLSVCPYHVYFLLSRPFPHLCSVPDLIALLHGISERYDVSPLLRYMLPHLVASVVQHVAGMWLYIWA